MDEDQMPDHYAYAIDQCDVTVENRAALQSYRDKRRVWLSWIDTDEHHAIWQVLSSMVWTDVSLKALTHFAINDEANCLNNSLSRPSVDRWTPDDTGSRDPQVDG